VSTLLPRARAQEEDEDASARMMLVCARVVALYQIEEEEGRVLEHTVFSLKTF
jgi:hypothetical protein